MLISSRILFKNKAANWILAIIAFLFIIRIFLPLIGLKVINYALEEKLDNYEGYIEDFDLSLLKGAYTLEGLVLKKKDSQEKPFIRVKEIDIALSWSALLRKEITGNILLNTINIEIVDSSKKEEKQTGEEEENWQDVFEVIIPINIENLTLKNSSLKFLNKSLENPIPVTIDQIELSADNLRTSRTEKADSQVYLKARFQEHAYLDIKGKVNILAVPFLGDLDVVLKEFKLNTINKNLRHYVPLDITRGELSVFSEVAIYSNEIKGYAKVFLNDADIIAVDQDYESIKHFLYEIVVGLGNWFLKNSDTKEVATYIPFEGKRSGFEVDTSKLLNTALDNKDDPLERKLDHSISLKD